MIIDVDKDLININDEQDNGNFREKEYTLDDCMIVRKTGAFPFNGIVTTPFNGKAITYSKLFLLSNVIEDLYKNILTNDELIKIKSKLRLAQRSPRKTIHTCINGVVTDHLGGTFDGQYVVLDDLKNHVDSNLGSNLVSLRGEDTYFNNDITISIIVMSKQQYEIIKDDPLYIETLKNLKIYIFDSTIENNTIDRVITKILHSLQHDAFTMSSSYIYGNNTYTGDIYDDNNATLMTHFLSKYAIENNYSIEPHYYSQDKKDEDDLLLKDLNEKFLNFMYYLVEKCDLKNIDTDIINQCYMTYGTVSEDIIREIIKNIDLNKLIELLDEFNKEFCYSLLYGTLKIKNN